jgi:hypothetical protein
VSSTLSAYIILVKQLTAVETVRSGATRPVRIRDPRPDLTFLTQYSGSTVNEIFIKKLKFGVDYRVRVLEKI